MHPVLRTNAHRHVWVHVLLGSVVAWGIVALLDIPGGRSTRSHGAQQPTQLVPDREADAMTPVVSPPWHATCDWKPRYAPAPVVDVNVRLPQVTGALADTAIRKAIRGKLDKIGSCYQTPLRFRPSLAGMVQVNFTIDPAGHATIDNGAGDLPEVGDCVATVISSIGFPPITTATPTKVIEQIDFSSH